MTMDISLKCKCGSVTGTALAISPTIGCHVRCTCIDCRAYMHFLQRSDLLGDDGGTELFQFAPSHYRIATGIEHFRCVQLSEKGMLRWYADCCKTPVGNTLKSAKFPFVGMPVVFMNFAASGQTVEQVLGPVLMTAFEHQATKKIERVAVTNKIKTAARLLRVLGVGFIKGKAKPSPFFDDSGKPIVRPRVLSAEERSALSDQT